VTQNHDGHGTSVLIRWQEVAPEHWLYTEQRKSVRGYLGRKVCCRRATVAPEGREHSSRHRDAVERPRVRLPILIIGIADRILRRRQVEDSIVLANL
jgi:hypothetical protein